MIEELFIHRGYYCMVLANLSICHRCGYVGVTPSSPIYGSNYDDLYGVIDVDVHGGLTFSERFQIFNEDKLKNLWWFGFDCGHAGDAPDPELFSADRIVGDDGQPSHPMMALIEHVTVGILGEVSQVRTRGYVREECISLANQFADEMGEPDLIGYMYGAERPSVTERRTPNGRVIRF